MGYPDSHSFTTSFRDPAGRLVSLPGRILRIVNSSGLGDLSAFLASETCQKFVAEGRVVRTEIVDVDRTGPQDSGISDLVRQPGTEMLVEHEKVRFPSFPYEWAPEMLCAAGRLTLDLSEDLLEEGFGLKDATPYNVLFRGAQPVFVDVLSFERRDHGDATWLPYAQFIRTFLLPLLSSKYLGLRLDQTLLSSRDGLEPESVYRWLKPSQRVRPPFLGLVSIPTWLAPKGNPSVIYRKKSLADPEKAKFILNALFRRLRRSLESVQPNEGVKSRWSDYVRENTYSGEQFVAKEGFIKDALSRFAPRRVLDVGCNTGHFSLIAARSGASVVSIDTDPVVVGALWRKGHSEGLDILPLAVDLTRPSPPTGWRNLECRSFLDRAVGYFDAVFMLAVVHHMMVGERVPVDEILDVAAELTRELLVIEYVGPEDSMFRCLARGRDELHRGLSHQVFEESCVRRFDILRTQWLGGDRRLYLLRKKTSGSAN